MIDEISAVNHLFVPVFCRFHGITALDPPGDGGQGDIFPVFIHHAALAEEQTKAGISAQGQN